MRCWTVDRKVSAYLEDTLSERERQPVATHLGRCSACANKVQSQRRMRVALSSLPKLESPADLTIMLRVMASKERLADRHSVPRLRKWRDNAELALKNLMRPIALPAAGGICAAVLLFMTLVPTFTWNRAFLEDVPLCDLTPSTEPILRSVAPIGFSYGDAEVDLRIDEHGRIINYSIISGSAGHEREALRRSIENNLLFTTFTPATAYGVPISGSVRLSFRTSRIDVKG